LTCVPEHDLGRFTFGKAAGLRDHGIGDQAVAVVRERVPHVAQLAASLAFAVQLRIGIRLRLVRFIAIMEEGDHRVVLDQALAILAEHRRHPHRVIHRQVDEPAKQHVVLRLPHELALRAGRLPGRHTDG